MRSVRTTGIVCFLLTFIAAILFLSEWYYNEQRLSLNVAKGISAIVIVLYTYFFCKFYKAVFEKEKKKHRNPTKQSLALLCFIVQMIFSVEILGLLMMIVDN
jgi:hypothetical protein